VHVAARIAAAAAPGETFVSRTVRDLVTGSGPDFATRGTHKLKGVPGDWEPRRCGYPRQFERESALARRFDLIRSTQCVTPCSRQNTTAARGGFDSQVRPDIPEPRRTMKRQAHTPEQIVRKMREGEGLITEGEHPARSEVGDDMYRAGATGMGPEGGRRQGPSGPVRPLGRATRAPTSGETSRDPDYDLKPTSLPSVPVLRTKD
jgi:hypothetical protein